MSEGEGVGGASIAMASPEEGEPSSTGRRVPPRLLVALAAAILVVEASWAFAERDAPTRSTPVALGGARASRASSSRVERDEALVREAVARAGAASSMGASSSRAQSQAVEHAIRKLKPGFRQCFNKGLEEDPSMSGRALFVANVEANGEVSSVDVRENSGLGDIVLDCIRRKVRNAEFPAGPAGQAIRLPVSFIKQ
jgi:hypothetical protein